MCEFAVQEKWVFVTCRKYDSKTDLIKRLVQQNYVTILKILQNHTYPPLRPIYLYLFQFMAKNEISVYDKRCSVKEQLLFLVCPHCQHPQFTAVNLQDLGTGAGG